MDRLDNHCLISIFKHMDLSSRFQASKTCKLWRALLQDSEALVNDVGDVFLIAWNDDISEVESILAVLSHLKKCRQLTLNPPGFLSEQRLNYELARFDNFVLTPTKFGKWDDSLVPCLSLLPSTVTRLTIEGCVSPGFSLNLPDSVQLETLSLTFLEAKGIPDYFRLPSTLSTYSFSFCNYSSVFDVSAFRRATVFFLHRFPIGPSLTDLKIGGLYFDNKAISYFLRMIREDSPNLQRISFQDVGFDFKDINPIIKQFLHEGMDDRLLPIQRIEFEKCTMHWDKAVDLLVRISDVKTIVIKLPQRYPSADFAALYELIPAIKEKGARLELTINSIKISRDPARIPVPSELSDVLSKLEMVGVNHTKLLKVILCGNDTELLTEIRLEDCIGFGDTNLESVAKWCKNLKKVKFKPFHTLGLDPVTDQCLQPFMVHWDDRKSTQLSIECLQPAQPFKGFGLPSGQEKGVFSDGKKWMVFRKACRLDGCDQMGTRLLIWDDQIDGGGKSMVITDYKRKFENNVRISVMDGRCVVQQKRGGGY